MTHVAHALVQEFPANIEAIHRLRQSDRHFSALCDRYHSVNRDIQHIETGVEAAADDRLEILKKQRLAMADEVAATLNDKVSPARTFGWATMIALRNRNWGRTFFARV